MEWLELLSVAGIVVCFVILFAVLQLFGIKSRLQRLIDLQERAEQRELDRQQVVNLHNQSHAPAGGERPFGVAG